MALPSRPSPRLGANASSVHEPGWETGAAGGPTCSGTGPGPWLSYLRAVERAYLAVWAEELSWMVGSAAPVLPVGVPCDLEEMAIGIGEIPGVDAERAHMGGRGQRASGGFDQPEQLVDLSL
jgi:hypothetical protein